MSAFNVRLLMIKCFNVFVIRCKLLKIEEIFASKYVFTVRISQSDYILLGGY